MLKNPNHGFTQHIEPFHYEASKTRNTTHQSEGTRKALNYPTSHVQNTKKCPFRVWLGCQCFFIFNLTFNNLFRSLKELEMLELFELTGK